MRLPKVQISPVITAIPNKTSLFIPVIIRGSKIVETNALIDSGAEGLFINKRIVAKHSLPTHRLLIPITAWNIDGTPNQEGKITTYARLNFSVGEREYTEWFLVTDLGDTLLILGLP